MSQITVTHTVKITLKGQEIELTADEARELVKALNEAVGARPKESAIRDALEAAFQKPPQPTRREPVRGMPWPVDPCGRPLEVTCLLAPMP